MSKLSTNLEDALAACLDDLSEGVSVAQCLARFPEHAAELAPLLQVAALARARPLPVLSSGGRARGRERMHAARAQRGAGSGWLRAWLGGLAAAAVLLALAAGAWLSWPGRDRRLGGESTAQPALPSLAATATPSAVPTATLTGQSSSTPSPSPSPTGEDAPATATSTPGPTSSATPTSRPTASATPSAGPPATPTTAPPAAGTVPAATTPRPPAVIRSPEETPEARETVELVETDEPTEPAETDEPSSATPARPTERPEASPTPGHERAATSTPDDDDHHSTPEPTEPPERVGRSRLATEAEGRAPTNAAQLVAWGKAIADQQ